MATPNFILPPGVTVPRSLVPISAPSSTLTDVESFLMSQCRLALPEMQLRTLRKRPLHFRYTYFMFYYGSLYGGSNSNVSNELTLSVNVLLTIYSPSAFSLLATDSYSTGT